MEGIRNMYYVYAKQKAEEVRRLREAQLAAMCAESEDANNQQ